MKTMTRLIQILSVATLSCLGWLVGAQELKRVTWKDLDDVVVEAGGAEKFLNNKEALKKYYRLRSALEGGSGHFPARSFWQIAHDARKHLPEIKGLPARLNETTNLGTRFEIELDLVKTGRRLGDTFDAHLNRHLKSISTLGDRFLTQDPTMRNKTLNEEKIRRYVERLSPVIMRHQTELDRLARQIEEIDKRLSENPKADDLKTQRRQLSQQRNSVQGEFQKKLSQSPNFKSYSAAVAHHFLSQESTKDQLAVKDADSVLDYFKRLRQNPQEILNSVDLVLRAPIVPSHIRAMIPEQETLLAEKKYQTLVQNVRTKINKDPALKLDGLTGEQLRAVLRRRDDVLRAEVDKFNKTAGRLFPVDYKIVQDGPEKGRLVLPDKLGRSVVVFEPAPRRVHTIWDGVRDQECIGGSCKYVHQKVLSPERYLTGALDRSQIHYVSMDGVGKGSTMIVPGMFDRYFYGSVDWRSSLLSNEVRVVGESSKRPLVEVAMDRLSDQRPIGTNGLVMSESTAVANSGVLPAAKGSLKYVISQPFGKGQFSHFDKDMAEAIINRPVKRNTGPLKYDGNMAFDASVKDAGNYRLLLSDAYVKRELAELDRFLAGGRLSEDRVKNFLDSDFLDRQRRNALIERVFSKPGEFPGLASRAPNVITKLSKSVEGSLADRWIKAFPENADHFYLSAGEVTPASQLKIIEKMMAKQNGIAYGGFLVGIERGMFKVTPEARAAFLFGSLGTYNGGMVPDPTIHLGHLLEKDRLKAVEAYLQHNRNFAKDLLIVLELFSPSEQAEVLSAIAKSSPSSFVHIFPKPHHLIELLKKNDFGTASKLLEIGQWDESKLSQALLSISSGKEVTVGRWLASQSKHWPANIKPILWENLNAFGDAEIKKAFTEANPDLKLFAQQLHEARLSLSISEKIKQAGLCP